MKDPMKVIIDSLASKRVDEAESYSDFKKECMANPTWKEVNEICNKYEYRLAPLSYVDVDSKGVETLYVRIITPRDSYLPDIFVEQERRTKKVEYRIQTTSHGALEINEYEYFIEAVTNARDMVRELEKIDMFELNRSVEEEEE